MNNIAFGRIKRILRLSNILQTVGSVICVFAFILTLATSSGSSAYHSPFPLSTQVLTLGLYLAIPIGAIALAFRGDPASSSLLLSQTLSVIAIGLGVIPIIAIFQGYLDPTLPWLFAFGYLTNIPAFICRSIPQTYISQRKKRGAPVGAYGNLNGIRMEMEISKRARFVFYSAFLGIIVAFISARILLASPNLIIWYPFVIIVFVSLIALIVYLQGGKAGWQQVVLDTYEKSTLWWIWANGSLASVLLRDPQAALEDDSIKLSLVKGGIPTRLRFHSRSDRDRFLVIVGLNGPVNI